MTHLQCNADPWALIAVHRAATQLLLSSGFCVVDNLLCLQSGGGLRSTLRSGPYVVSTGSE